jgi:hypothetical protein
MLYYNLKCKYIYKRYLHKAAQYYSKRLRARLDGSPFQIKPPTKGFTPPEKQFFILHLDVDPDNFFP